MASAAIPGIFPPVKWQHRQLIDGGVSNYVPISHAIDLGADTIYVLTTGNACALDEAPSGVLAMLLHSMSVLVSRRLVVEVELLSEAATILVLPPPCPLSILPNDFTQADELIARSLDASRNYLAAAEADPFPPIAMHFRGHKRPE